MSQIKSENQKNKFHQRKTRKEREEILRERMGLLFLNHKELSFLKDTFKSLDKNNSGIIDKESLEQTLNSFGCSFDQGKLMNLFNEIDKKSYKSIDFDEFLDCLSSEIKFSEDTLRQVFESITGKEGDYINFEQLKKIKSILSDEELRELIESTDNTHSGKVNFEDFYKMIMTKV